MAQRMASNKLTNQCYVQWMTKLEASHTGDNLVSLAFTHYDKISEPKHSYSINKLLKICSTQAVPSHQIFSIWDDVTHTNNIQHISQGLLLKICGVALKQRLKHAEIKQWIQILQCILTNSQLKDDMNVYCLLIQSFGLCADINNAERTFDAVATHKINADIIRSLMTAYVNNKHHHKAISLYQKYAHLTHNEVTHLMLIKACQHSRNFDFAHEIISQKIDYVNGKHNMRLLNTLMHFYGECKDVDAAERVFESIPSTQRNVIHTNCIMTCYLNNDLVLPCLTFYEQSNVKDDVSHLLALKACAKYQKYNEGNRIIREHIKFDNINKTQRHSIELLTTMIDFYEKCKDIESAIHVFQFIFHQQMINDVCIGVMMKAYINNDRSDDALSLYRQTSKRHLQSPTSTTHLWALKACIILKEFEYGEQIIKNNRLNTYVYDARDPDTLYTLNTLIEFYGKIGDIPSAWRAFQSICDAQKQNIMSITVMMNAYCDNQMNIECIELFKSWISHRHLRMNHISLATALKAAIHESALHFGEAMAEHFKDNKCIFNHIDVQLNFICLYGKCHKLNLCDQIFENIKTNEAQKYGTDIRLWNAMLNAYARNGKIQKMMQLLHAMTSNTKLIPNGRTYCILLNTFASNPSHSLQHFDDIWNQYIMNEEVKPYQMHTDLMPRKELLDTFNLFLLCLGIKHDLANKNEFQNDVLTANFCALPVHQMKNDDNIESFREIMLLVQNNDETQNKQCVDTLMQQLRSKITQGEGNEKECLSIVNAYGLMGNTEEMMKEYKTNTRLNSDILICLLHHLIRHGKPQYVGDIWNDIIDMSIRLNALALQALVLCVNRSMSDHDPHLLLEMWDYVVNEHKVKPSIHCFCFMIWSFSKSSDVENIKMTRHLLAQLKGDKAMQSLLATNHIQFIQILNAYGNISEFDQMWSFYSDHIHKWNGGRHDVYALKVLCSMDGISSALLDEIFETIDSHFSLNDDLSNAELITLHRIANKTGNKWMEDKIWEVLQNKDEKIKTNVMSYFMLNGEQKSVSSGYEAGGCSFNSHDKVNALMKEIGYEINTAHCTQLPSEMAKIQHLKSHSEKKALAILLKQETAHDIKDIKIKVSMKMCLDCHEFFCQISKQYSAYNIECVDPKGVHSFQNGTCHLCCNV
eukprot:437846_1